MKIRYSKSFVEDYKKIPQHKQKKIDKAIKLIQEDLYHPGLNTRKMVGVSKWEARVDYHYRLTFEIVGEAIQMSRVGTHDIYRNP